MADKALCSIPDCGKPYCARGYCSTHYKRIIQKGYKRPPTDPCKIDGCETLSHGHGLCVKHYKRFLRHGDPLAGGVFRNVTGDAIERAVAHTDADSCLIWPFSRNRTGYGEVRLNKKTRLAHRVICVRVHGEPPTPKHEAAHLCGKGHEGCVNPHHLAWKTCAENNADKLIHGTHNKGVRHPFAKLTNEQVRHLRQSEASRTETFDEIAKQYGVSGTSIRLAVRGLTYRDA